MQARLLILRQDKGESKKQFFEGIEAYESIGYKTIHSYCYDRINKLAEVTLALRGTYNKIECEDGIIECKIVSDFSNTENGINGGWLN